MKKRKIRDLREAKGWSQSDLAAAVGVSKSTVVKWEAGKVEPRAAKLLEMAREFGVSMDAIDFPIVDTQQGKTRDRRQDEPDAGDRALTGSHPGEVPRV